jgi:tetratricopeptide (TPR) repeat protein
MQLLQAGLQHQQAGQMAQAEAAYRQVLQSDPQHADALHLLGLVAYQRQQYAAAVDLIKQAVASNGLNAVYFFNLAMALNACGHLREAAQAYARAFALHPDFPEAHYGIITTLRDLLARDEPVSGLLPHVPSSMPAAPVSPLEGKISVIICSVTPEKFARVTQNYAELLAGEAYEIIGIHDAKSLCEGYNRGVAQSSGEILIFCHDDIEILTADFKDKLRRQLAAYDVIGVAGTSRLIGQSWAMAGWPHLHGQVLHLRPGTNGPCELCVYGPPALAPIQAMDGLFFAARRRVLETVMFDEKIFDGFHLYDLDFTFSAYLAGFKLGVCNDIAIAHHSMGSFDDAAWQRYATAFIRKYSGKLSSVSPGKAYRGSVRLHTKQQALALLEVLAG